MGAVLTIDFPCISLAAARVNAGLTQKELANACEVSESTVVSWESGKTKPSAKKLPLIERAVGISLNFIDFTRR